MSLSAITFLYPAMLAGLMVLPIVWLLIRSAPRSPKNVIFPAARLLRGLKSQRRDIQRAPIWQTILRCLILTLLIIAAARPVMNRNDFAQNDGAVLIIADNGWESAANWTQYRTALQQIANQARFDLQTVYLAQTAPEAAGASTWKLPEIVGPVSSQDTVNLIDRLHPRPWNADYTALSDLIAEKPEMNNAIGSIIWLTGDMDGPGKASLAHELQDIAPITVLSPTRSDRLAITSLTRTRTGMVATIAHDRNDNPRVINLLARGERGTVLLRHNAELAANSDQSETTIFLPSDIANAIQSVGIEGVESAATMFQTGARWQQRRVGVIVSSGDSPGVLSDQYFFLDRALSPYAEVTYEPLGKLLEKKVDILVATGPISGLGSQFDALERWVNDGGMLVRFAGDSSTEIGNEFLPVTLRLGNRDFGGSMSWEKPKRLLDFPDNSPFYGIPVPNDITVNRQLLAEPDPDILGKTWARLTDGTPLITSAPRNSGRVVLFHVTPWADWSNLPMSGLFVELWQKILPLASPSNRNDAELSTSLPPQAIMDGFGQTHQPDALILPVRAPLPVPSPRHPPGIYGENGQAVALNLGPSLTNVANTVTWPSGVSTRKITDRNQVDLAALCLLGALLLLLFDALILLALHHLTLRRNRRSNAFGSFLLLIGVGGIAAGLLAVSPNNARASTIQEAALQPRLAYLKTGVPPVDRLSQAGMTGLTEYLRRRSAADLNTVDGIDPETDELSFYPLIYWPLVDGQEPFSERARERLNSYLNNGGMILIDSRDREVQPARLRRLLAGLEVPLLDRAPGDHILFRSFYLLDHAYGRFSAPLWLDARPNQRLDGVASVLFGGNDWASAWMIPEGRDEIRTEDIAPRQREMAVRFGINLVMYALTGSYKGDQVHLPAILERLGR
ncbi:MULTISPECIES: DUF4159 domain-containing protein [Thalassospira]|uniref:DUF4159 domain-containing protein n=2 Tax=Thalassospira TaxID=168934 RepID=A0A367W7V6_9PROT|nr:MULTISPECIES: DUF4159 domain-containing protein [Thalassospira]MDG4720487.1 DUF4159 domain-containing protein [Thalassospira sp. FZY0004]RCK37528.1 hypothetical protein TH19_09725 [Thalassospira profundimaris]